jgi:hypothetical protein
MAFIYDVYERIQQLVLGKVVCQGMACGVKNSKTSDLTCCVRPQKMEKRSGRKGLRTLVLRFN